jgi:hypothetical protein
MNRCEICSAKVAELRRGRCWGCYNRWVDSRPVGIGACCTLCGERRRGFLRSVELLGAWMPLCHNCGHRALQLDPMPATIAEIRQSVDRERRREERRQGKKDTRVFRRNRRGADERRRGRGLGDDLIVIDDEMIVEVQDQASTAAVAAHRDGALGRDEIDLTRIRELPAG